jgi:hypothetical protein
MITHDVLRESFIPVLMGYGSVSISRARKLLVICFVRLYEWKLISWSELVSAILCLQYGFTTRDPEILDKLCNGSIVMKDRSVFCENGYERTKPLNYGILLETSQTHKNFKDRVLKPVRKTIRKDMNSNPIFMGDEKLWQDIRGTDHITLMAFMLDPKLCLHYLCEITYKLKKHLFNLRIEIKHLKKIAELSQALTTKALLYFYIWKHEESTTSKVELLHAVKPTESQLNDVERAIYIGNAIRHLVAVLLGKLSSSVNHRSPICHAKIYSFNISQLQKLGVNLENYKLPSSEEVMRIVEIEGDISLTAFAVKKGEKHIFLEKNQELISRLEKKFQTHFNHVDEVKIKNWLLQFGNEHRMELALKLLENVEYIDENNIVDMFREFYYNGLSPDLRKKAVFAILGGLQDSTSHIAYLCSKALEEKEKVPPRFMTLKDIIKDRRPDDTVVVFLDDALISGTQVIRIFEEWLGVSKGPNEYVQKLEAEEINWLRQTKLIYFVVVACEEGISRFKKRLADLGLKVRIFASRKTEQALGCFRAPSLIFNSKEERLEAEEMAAEIGYELLADKNHWPESLRKERSLGYGNLQKLLVFSHNTPTCTLPIFWKEEEYKGKKWIPIFPRRG